MNQRWANPNQPSPAPANPAQPGAGSGDPMALIKRALLNDQDFLMQLIQRLSAIAQQSAGAGAGARPPAGPAGPMPGNPGGM